MEGGEGGVPMVMCEEVREGWRWVSSCGSVVWYCVRYRVWDGVGLYVW